MSAMPYTRSNENIVAQLSTVLDKPEISAEIEAKGLRRKVIEQVILDAADRLWQSVSSRVEYFDLVEQAIERIRRKSERPKWPALLNWTKRMLWSIGGGVLFCLLTGSLGFLFKGLLTTNWFSSYQHAIFSRLTLFAAVNLGLAAAVIGVFRSRTKSRYEESLIAWQDSLNAELKVPQADLLTARKEIEESLSQAVQSQLLAYLASEREDRFGNSLPIGGTDGLSQVQNPEFEIVTPSGDRLKRLIGAVNGASIGISGSRGAGKTTLLLSQYDIGNTKPNVLSVFTSAPVEYDSREFVLHLFASVCSRILEKAMGRRNSVEEQTRFRQEAWEREKGRQRIGRSPLRRLTQPGGRSLAMLGTLLIYLGLALAFLKVHFARPPVGPSNDSKPVYAGSSAIHVVVNYAEILGLSPSALLLWGGATLMIAIFASPILDGWREQEPRGRGTSRPDLTDFEYEDELREKGAHVLAAHYHLSNIRFQQSFTSGWSGALKLPVALERSVKSDRSWAEKPRSLPDIVEDYRRYLEQIVGSDENPYEQVLICIDELDKLASDEIAERFLNGIKSVFNQKRCYYLVSVSENAMSSFERRGLPIRDVFDSSFDEVIYVDNLKLAESKRLLSRRVLNLPDPFACFAHVLSGGLPRDLLRVGRAMFDARVTEKSNDMGAVCRAVVANELSAKLRAIAVAARKCPSLPRSLINDMLSATVSDVYAMWALVARLRAYQAQLKGNGSREVEETSENAVSNSTLTLEALMLTFFYVTVSEMFKALDEASWLASERSGLFEQMAAIRRSLTQDAATTASSIEAARQEFKLASAEQWLGTMASGGSEKEKFLPAETEHPNRPPALAKSSRVGDDQNFHDLP
jgi:hypothetical protein